MKIEDVANQLDAPVEDTDESITGLGLPEPGDEPEDKDQDDPTDKPQESTFDKAEKQDGINVRDAVLEALSEVANQIPAAPAPQANQAQVTKYEQEIEKLKAKGVPQEAIDNFDALIAAHTEGVLQRLDQVNYQKSVEGFQASLYQGLSEALDDVGASVNTIKNAGRGAKADLIDQAMRYIFQHPEFSGIKQTIDSFGLPSKNEFKRVTAKVVDQYCKDNGITPKSQGINLKSSKPDTSADTTFDVNSMSRKQRAIYELNMKTSGDKAKALKRARSVS